MYKHPQKQCSFDEISSLMEIQINNGLGQAPYIDLNNLIFDKIDFSKCNFPLNMKGSYHPKSGSNISFVKCTFNECDFRGLSFDSAKMIGCEFNGCNFIDFSARYVDFTKSIFVNCFLFEDSCFDYAINEDVVIDVACFKPPENNPKTYISNSFFNFAIKTNGFVKNKLS